MSFVGVGLPGDELTVTVEHVGMQDGNIVVNVTTNNARGEKVLEGAAEVTQPSTIYVFTVKVNVPRNLAWAWTSTIPLQLVRYGTQCTDSIIQMMKDNPKG